MDRKLEGGGEEEVGMELGYVCGGSETNLKLLVQNKRHKYPCLATELGYRIHY